MNFEDNSTIGDKVNDNLRILGKNLKCKVVGEGGNLGFTQKGRIEYSKRGGRINTDFIDNSAGVDCSDHEVNIKIALQHELQQKNISLEDRNKILIQLTNDIEKLVLKDNHDQSILLNMENYSNINNLKDYSWLISCLEEKGELQREIESLPSNEDITKLGLENKSLTRPEIAVLVAYSKNSIAKILASHDFTKDKFFQDMLLSYFPNYLQENFKKSLLLHKLSNEIIITIISNEFVNTLGCTTFHLLASEKGFHPINIIKSFYLLMASTDIKSILNEINSTSTYISVDSRYKLLNRIQSLIKSSINWILINYNEIDDIESIIQINKKCLIKLYQIFDTDSYLKNTIIKRQIKKINGYIIEAKKSKNLISNIAYFSLINSFYNIITINKFSKIDLNIISKVYFKIRERLYIDQILELLSKRDNFNHIEKLAYDYVENELRKITIEVVFHQLKDYENVDKLSFIKDHNKLNSFDIFINKVLIENEDNKFVAVQVIINKLKTLINT